MIASPTSASERRQARHGCVQVGAATACRQRPTRRGVPKADPSKSARATVTVAYENLLDGGGPVAPAVRLFALRWGPSADVPADAESA